MKYLLLVFPLLMCMFGVAVFIPAIGLGEPVCGWENYTWYARLIGLIMGPLLLWSAWSIIKEIIK